MEAPASPKLTLHISYPAIPLWLNERVPLFFLALASVPSPLVACISGFQDVRVLMN
jgi:hypothetical protein